MVTVELPVARLAGFLLAKIHAAYGRRATKDWYDVAFVLLHNDEGGPAAAGDCVRSMFGSELIGATRTALGDLADNFATPLAQGPLAYAETVLEIYPGLDWDVVVNDAVIAVAKFLERLDANRDRAPETREAPGR
ncbi:MAG: hypothetical protein DCC49_05085 [Acidobacteria bacterium]|nr:MAG: hypothetical protein DCC49_05085 [Acidobacteriota bacterium]